MTTTLSARVIVVLALGGNTFANLSVNAVQARKKTVEFFSMTVAVPFVRNALHSSRVLL